MPSPTVFLLTPPEVNVKGYMHAISAYCGLTRSLVAMNSTVRRALYRARLNPRSTACWI